MGGTPSGVAAAVTAARAGERVDLVSAASDLGGTLTDAMMDQWDLNLATDGSSLDGGMFGEMYARLGDVFTPDAARRTFADLVADEPNVAVRYDEVAEAIATSADGSDRRVDAVTFRNTRSGVVDTLEAPYVIDATDAGDVAALAGARYDLGRQDSGPAGVLGATPRSCAAIVPFLDDLARANRETEIEASRLLSYLRARLPGVANARIGIFAADVYVRETRHIAGVDRLTTQDVWDGRIPADSIGLASYPIDLHPVDPTDQPSYAPERHVYGIPFGALVPAGLSNILLASPAISASHLASGSARVIPTTIEEGRADAIAIAVAARRNWTFGARSHDGSLVAAVRRDLALAIPRAGERFA